MTVEVDELYSNVNKLLYDICEFLNDKATYEKLSPYARKQADELISRSKLQLQEIAKVSSDDNEYNAYVDMERMPGKIDEDDKNNIYSSVVESAVITPPPVIQPQLNSYANLPARDLSQDIKYGYLSWKCKIILRFEKFRRIYAGVHNNWLLIYSCEKDLKPSHTFDLRFHKAQEVISKQIKNPPRDFELISTAEGGKSCYFLALSHKDMLQWTSHINRCYESLNKSDNLSEFEDSGSEAYAELETPAIEKEEQEEEEEEIYHDIETYIQRKEEETNKPPDLPARRFMVPTNRQHFPIPPKIDKNNGPNTNSLANTSVESINSFSEEEDEENIYEPFVSNAPDPAKSRVDALPASITKSEESVINSFSEEDEEDNIYEPFVSKPPEIVKPIVNIKNDKESHNSVRNSVDKPKTPEKPNIFRPRPKYFPAKK